jgi:cytoskeletal protein CcmA (bactofilin family)
VKANISGRVVTVEGEVEGDLRAQEQVILRSSARVQGDLTAPRVVLEDGANFRGLVDMGEASRHDAPSRARQDATATSRGSNDTGTGPSIPSVMSSRSEKGTPGATDSATP